SVMSDARKLVYDEFASQPLSSNGMSEEVEYRSSISSRPEFKRTTGARDSIPSGSGNRVLKIVTEMSSSSYGSGLSPFGQNAASTIRDSREREKKEIMELNDKLANYIENVRFLEAQNRKLEKDLEFLRSRSGQGSHSVKIIYQTEITTAKEEVVSTGRKTEDFKKDFDKFSKQVIEIKKKFEEATAGRLEDRAKIDELLVILSNLEAEINLLKRRIALLEEEVRRLKNENLRLMGELNKCRSELDRTTLERIDAQNQVTTLLEEINFIKAANEKDIISLQARVSRDTTPENREFFKNELANAIRDIRADHEALSNANRQEMDSWYKKSVQEIHTQSARQGMEQEHQKEDLRRMKTQVTDLRSQLADLEGRNTLLEKQIEDLNYQLEDDQRSYEAQLNDRDAQIRKLREECQALMVELQMLLDQKQTLDAEMSIYRKLLDGANDNGQGGLRQLVEQVVKTTGLTEVADTETMKVIKGETSSRTSYTRSAKGNVSIQETDEAGGKFVVLENTHRGKEEPIGGWKLKRKIDNKREIVFTFPADFVLKQSAKVKIFARGAGVASPPDVLVMENDDTFGVGANVNTLLYNKEGEERATHIQRSSQSGTTN
ncbi:hypothetical protein PENTCL1PPCAC_28554, partial [Pristionchus entomophagus]